MDEPRLVDWRSLGRRVGRVVVVVAVLAVLGAAVTVLVDGWSVRVPLAWAFLAVAGVLVAAVVLVAGSALRGMLRAGERGERLAGEDVGVIPPQLRRRPPDEEGS